MYDLATFIYHLISNHRTFNHGPDFYSLDIVNFITRLQYISSLREDQQDHTLYLGPRHYKVQAVYSST